jgi:hypothetical protein
LAEFSAERIALTRDQARAPDVDRLSIEVKPSDSRSEKYVEQYGNRCWEVDVLPEDTIRQALDDDIRTWLNREWWDQRDAEIERARDLL